MSTYPGTGGTRSIHQGLRGLYRSSEDETINSITVEWNGSGELVKYIDTKN